MQGLYLLWWVQEKHVPAAIVAALLATADLAIAALEIPTGWLADRYGHRVSVIIGSLAQVGGMVMCWLGEGVPGLLVAVLLVAVGDAFRSGAGRARLAEPNPIGWHSEFHYETGILSGARAKDPQPISPR